VGAVVVVRLGATLDEGELRSFLAERIARHKVPATIWFRTDPLPRNANGKFVKRDLRTELLAD
jgi:long-chain acyl-CoA synthetase